MAKNTEKNAPKLAKNAPKWTKNGPKWGKKYFSPIKPSQLITHMTYLHHIFVPKSKDSQKWGKMAKNGSKNPKIKKIQKVCKNVTQKHPTPRKSAF